MTSERRCPSCGALVSEDAQWCGQCYTSLVEEPETEPEPIPSPPPAPATVESAAVPATDPATDPETDRPAPTPPATATAAYWSCPACGEHNGLESDRCSVCGTPFARLFEEPGEIPDVPRGKAVGWSLLYPGLGHRLLDRGAEGLARGAVFTLALGAMFYLILGRGGRGLGAILWILAIYALFAIAVYVFTAVEAGAIADGGEPLVSPRAFAWIAAALVLVSLGVSVFIAVGATRGR